MMTASLRATATAARLKPIFSRSFRPHVRRLLAAWLWDQDYEGGFVEKRAHVGVAAPGDMTIIVDLARLIAPRGQAEP